MLYVLVLVPKEKQAKKNEELAGRTGCGTSKWWKLLTPSSWALDGESWMPGSWVLRCQLLQLLRIRIYLTNSKKLLLPRTFLSQGIVQRPTMLAKSGSKNGSGGVVPGQDIRYA